FSMTMKRAEVFRQLLRKWVDGLYRLYPHTESHRSWWAFPFERLIGLLQKINTNSHIGGELEMTILNSFSRAANFRRAVNRPNPSPVMSEFQRLFEKAFSTRNNRPETFNEMPPDTKGDEHARYMHCGVNYSRSSTHLGNSLIRYLVNGSSQVGSIEKIRTVGDEVKFFVRRQLPLPGGEFDPFSRYAWFPACSLSATMSDHIDIVSPRHVLTHVARFQYKDDRVVVLDLARD
ncbi:hypothetical protein V5O48_014981, partial [Marasmius crinis-equi]